MGVSFSPDSKIDRRKLASALLWAGEARGRDAAGFAFVTSGGETGMYKKDVPASRLTTAPLPQNAEAIILHTRAATHGSPKDMRNNHPVESPNGTIRLVHNGVIWNHDTVRQSLGELGTSLPEVDSSVIPAVIESLGLDALENVSGDAAVAWFDTETGAVLHLARLSNSPLHAATLLDGTTVFASTPAILHAALQRMDLTWMGNWPGTFYEFVEGEYIQLFEGNVTATSKLEWGDDYDWYNADRYRKVTSGSAGGWADDTPSGGYAMGYDDFESDRPAALTLPALNTARSNELEDLFWVEEHDGARTTFVSLHAMLGMLSWYNGMSDGTYELVDPADEKSVDMVWVNHIGDLGEIDLESGEFVSWVSKPNEMQDWGSLIKPMLRDGVDVLRKVLV